MRRRALIVEDDAATRHALIDLVSGNGVEIDWAADGATAVGYLARERYDVVILDLVLPKISGTEIMEHLACTQPHTLANTIVVTGVDLTEIRRLFPDVRDALAKPVIPSRLLRAIRMCLAPALEENGTARGCA